MPTNLRGKLPQDAFERLRVSDPTSVFDAKMQYDLQPLLFESSTAGGGSVAHDADKGCAEMTVGTSLGDQVVRQSRQYCTYQPGKSQAIFVTGSFGAREAGIRQRMGYFDSENGCFLEQTSTGIYIVFRSNVSGTPVDTRVHQSEWNLDPYGGLDLEHSQILVIDLQWLGVGRVRVGFDIGGKLRYVHQFYNDNQRVATYWTTATLPVRYEIENIGTPTSGTTMRQICCSVQSEGGLDLNKGFSFSCSNGATTVAVTTRRPVLSIRPGLTFNSITNRAGIIPTGWEGIANNNGSYIEVVYGGTLTTPTWVAVDATNSAVECDVASTSISGGVVVWSGYLPSTGNKSAAIAESGFPNLLWLTNNIAGNDSTPLSIVATSLSATSNVTAALRWVEVR